MQSSAIERIIGNDRKARETVAAAKRHQKKTSEEVALKKAKLEAEAKAELEALANDARESTRREISHRTEEYKKNAGRICTAMEKLYREKKDEWIHKYTTRIIQGE